MGSCRGALGALGHTWKEQQALVARFAASKVESTRGLLI